MRRLLKLVLQAVVIVAVACTSAHNVYEVPKFRVEEKINFKLLTEDQLWGGQSSIFKYGELLAVVTFSKADETWLHIFKSSGEHLGDYIHTGRGPEEILYVSRAHLSGSILYLMAPMDKKMLAVDLSKIVDGGDEMITQTDLVDDSNWLFYSFPVSRGNTVGIYHPRTLDENCYDSGRICLFDSEGKIVSSYGDSPYDDYSPAAREFLELAMSNQVISPDGKHLAITQCVGAVLELFSIDNAIRCNKTMFFVKPEFEETGNTVGINEESVAGLGRPCADDDYLYCPYDCENRYDEASANCLFSRIAIFRWNGSAEKIINTDYRIDSLTTDDEGETFYAVVSDPDRREYLARLK